MITGAELKAARNHMKLQLHHVAHAAGIRSETLRNWEAMDVVKVRDKKKLAKLIRCLGFNTEQTLKASLPEGWDVSANMVKEAAKSVQSFAAETKDIMKSVDRAADVAELTQMLGWFMGDQARRSNLGRLLKAACRCNLTIHGLERAIDGNG